MTTHWDALTDERMGSMRAWGVSWPCGTCRLFRALVLPIVSKPEPSRSAAGFHAGRSAASTPKGRGCPAIRDRRARSSRRRRGFHRGAVHRGRWPCGHGARARLSPAIGSPDVGLGSFQSIANCRGRGWSPSKTGPSSRATSVERCEDGLILDQREAGAGRAGRPPLRRERVSEANAVELTSQHVPGRRDRAVDLSFMGRPDTAFRATPQPP